MRQFLCLSFAILLTISTGYSQDNVNSASEKRRFRITSFLVDGRTVSDIKVLFLLNGKEIATDIKNGVIFVPDEMLEASWEKSGVRFTAPDIDFVFEKVLFKGYLDADDFTSDYEISITTDPAKIKQILKDNEKRYGKSRSIRASNYKKVCSVYSWTASNIVVNKRNPNLIVDPITTEQFNFCKRNLN